jgi:TP901 family phage tail tape measure protein
MSLEYVISASDKFSKTFDDLDKKVAGAGKSMRSLGATMTKAVTGPILAVGTAAFAAANAFDKASKTIRVGTGATGDELQALEADFKAVFKGVPQSADEVSTAIADLNTRTGLAGTPLQALSKQMLDLARITGTDVAPLIASTTRVFGDWDVATDDVADTLDYLFKVSQTTGIGVDDLASKVVAFGSPLRAMGFDLETSAALFGKFEQEGVNAELVIGSLRQGLGNLARAGKEPAREFPKLIERIRDAGDMGQSTALAMELFGARAGPDMAAAIVEGRFEIADLMATLQASGETIEKAGADALGFGERMGMMKNVVMGAIEPIGRIILDLAEEKIVVLTGKIEELADWFGSLDDSAQKTILIFAGVAGAIGPALWVMGALAGAISSITAIVAPLIAKFGALTGLAALGPVGWTIIAVLAALGIAFSIAWKYSETFRDTVTSAWNKVKDAVTLSVTVIKDVVGNAMTAMWNFVKPVVSEVGAFFAEVFGGIYAWTVENWPLIKDTIVTVANAIWEGISGAFNDIWTIIKTVYGWLESTFIFIWPALEAAIRLAWEAIKLIVSTTVDIVLGVLKTLMQLITGDFAGAWETVKETVINVVGNVKEYIENAFGIIGDIIGRIMDAISVKVTNTFDGIKTTIKSVINSVISTINRFTGAVSSIRISVPSVDIPLIGTVGGFSVGMPSIPKIPSLNIGTNLVMSDGLAEIHKGESIVPARVKGGGYRGNGGGDTHFHITGEVIDGAAFDRFVDKISRKLAYDVGGAR